MRQGKIAQKSERNSERKMAAGYDKALFQNPGRIYNNFGHGKWICYDRDTFKILREYIKKKRKNRIKRRK